MKRLRLTSAFGLVLVRSNSGPILLLTYLGLLGIGALAHLTSAPTHLAQLMLGATAAIWAGLVAGRGLALWMGLAAVRAPRAGPKVCELLLAAGLPGLALPIVLGLALGLPVDVTLLACVHGALIGALLMLLPQWCWGVGFLLWMLQAQLAPALSWPSAMIAIPLLLLANTGLWLRASRRLDRGNDWSMPLALAQPGDGGLFSSSTNGSNPLGDWFNTLGRRNVDRTPAQTMATALGAPFHRRGWRALAFLLLNALLLGLLMLVMRTPSRALADQLMFIGTLALIVSAVIPAQRLHALRARPSAEFAELPLLPGLTSAGSLQRSLRRAAAASILRTLVPLATLILAGGLYLGAPDRALLGFGVITGGAVAAGIAMAWWAAGPRSGYVGFPITILVVCLFALSAIAAAFGGAHGMTAILAGLAVLLALLAWGAFRALQHMPHPFLIEAGNVPWAPANMIAPQPAGAGSA